MSPNILNRRSGTVEFVGFEALPSDVRQRIPEACEQRLFRASVQLREGDLITVFHATCPDKKPTCDCPAKDIIALRPRKFPFVLINP